MRTGTSDLALLVAAALFPAATASGQDVTPDPLPFPVYVASGVEGPLVIDGKLEEPAWRATALGWGLSHAHEPNVLCPDPTLFRLAYDDQRLYLCLACYKRDVQEDLPDHVWKPREMELIDTQAMPRHARERGVEPPVNIAQVLLSRGGRTVTLIFAPPRAPAARVHDALGERDLPLELEHAYGDGPDDRRWTVEARVAWRELGFEPPRPGDDWAFNVYRDVRFFSNWAFIAWMRDWGKAEYSRFDLTERFGRLWFADASPAADAVERRAAALASRRGPVRVFTADALLLVEPGETIVRQRYAERAAILRAYAEGLRRERQRIGNDLPYHPFFTEKKPREHLAVAGRKLARLYEALNEKPLLDDPASTVARISHAIPEARDGLYTYKKERLYRGLPE